MIPDFSDVTNSEIKFFYAKISKNVKKMRQEKGLSQMDLALDIGIKSIAFFSNAECNRYGKHFNLEHLYKIAKALDKDVCEFLK